MIPALPKDALSPCMHRFVETLKQNAFDGDIHWDMSACVATSTDNSIYQLKPQLVLYPRTKDAIVTIFKVGQHSEFQSITFAPRGGGTGTNGQSLTQGVMIDCTRYMHHIKTLNVEEQWVSVEPAVVLDQLNDAVKQHGLFFAPHLSPGNRATLGGMVNTDACGKGSRLYGRTSQHIMEIEFVCVDGTEITTKAITLTELDQKLIKTDKEGYIYQTVNDVISQNQSEIQNRFPNLIRFMTGYNLAKVLDDEQNAFNLNYILSGSEGTLVFVTGLKLKLTPIPPFKMLFALQYDSFEAALRSARQLLKAHPAAIETVDDHIIHLAKQDEIYTKIKPLLATPSDKPLKALNLIELIGNTSDELNDQAEALKKRLDQLIKEDGLNTYYATTHPDEINQLWRLRKKGVGLLGNMQGDRKPVPFMEDTAVPPENLADYIVELRALLAKHDLEYGMFGHVDVGCLHMRPALDMTLIEHQKLVSQLTYEVNELVKKYGGIYWSEHGKGFRSEYVKQYFGEKLYDAMSQIKYAFDPNNRLNPGKIVVPKGSNDPLVKVNGPYKGRYDAIVDRRVRRKYAGAFNCNGNAACLNYDFQDVMCPSAKVSRNLVHSPKGRSELLREWLHQMTQKQYKGLLNHGKVNWWHWFKSLFDQRVTNDFSHEVYDSMEKCLGCKACAFSCPVKVNIPNMRADFLSQYHTRYRRPLKDFVMGANERIVYLQAKMPNLANRINNNKLTSMITQAIGLQDLPVLSDVKLKDELNHRRVPKFTLKRLRHNINRGEPIVCLVQDIFTSFYQPQIMLDTYDLLSQLGYRVYVLPFRENGKALHNKGFLKAFNKRAKNNARFYNQIHALGAPLIGIEPSMTLCYRDEYVHQLGNEVSFKVHMLDEWLADQLHSKGINKQKYTGDPVDLYLHCSEKALAFNSRENWRLLFEGFGLKVRIQETGCCGMAGAYGHEYKHYENSKKLYNMSWQYSIENAANQPLVTGFSCRCQINRFSHQSVDHPVSKLKAALKI